MATVQGPVPVRLLQGGAGGLGEWHRPSRPRALLDARAGSLT